jgi:phosphoribosyl 1,2-cyclic phosphodiesterase
MSKPYIRFWGVRGSYAAPFPTHLKVGGNTSCVEVNVDDTVLICDAGTGIIPLGNKLVAEAKNKELLIVLTHYHWDHICGLPFFVPAFIPDWNLTFFGPGDSKQEVKQKLDSQMQAPYFPVGTYGYRIKAANKTIIYISDNECQFLDKSIKQKMSEFNKEEQQMFQEMNREEYEYELNTIRGADILIHDAQYTPEDYKTKRGWGHSCYVDVVNYAIDADVKELYLYHHDPYNDDDAIDKIHQKCEMMIKECGAPLICKIAREGMEIELD